MKKNSRLWLWPFVFAKKHESLAFLAFKCQFGNHYLDFFLWRFEVSQSLWGIVRLLSIGFWWNGPMTICCYSCSLQNQVANGQIQAKNTNLFDSFSPDRSFYNLKIRRSTNFLQFKNVDRRILRHWHCERIDRAFFAKQENTYMHLLLQISLDISIGGNFENMKRELRSLTFELVRM